jgi:hypothetical protein
LLGPGPSEVDSLIPWDRPDLATLLGDGPIPPGPLGDLLSSFDAAIAFTRNETLAGGLAAVIPRVLVHEPSPPERAGHAAIWLSRPLPALGVEPPRGLPPVLRPTPVEREAAASLLERLPPGFLAIHAGSGSPTKNWPADRFAFLAESLSEGRPWLLVEGPAEAASARTLRDCPNAVPAASLSSRVLGAALAEAGVYVGNDSGVSHLAAAWGAPTVALFGPTDPAVWSPLGPCVTTVRSADGAMSAIAIAEVEIAARRIRR